MMFLAVHDVSKSYGAISVLNDISFIINDGDRVGIVGSNGVGKSTLLKILVGQEEVDGGTFSFAPSIEVGYLPQITPDFYGRTIEDLILESLETYLSHYSGAIIMVSHDRQFLNRAVNQIFEIDEYNHHLKRYEGNYDAYTQTKAAERTKWEEDYERQQDEVKELRKRIRETARQVGHTYRAPRDNDKYARYFFAQRVDSTVSRNVRAAEEQLKRIEADPIPRPPELIRVSSYFRTEPIQSRVVLSATDLTKCWGERCILSGVDVTVPPDARIVLIGPNGTGKTTLLKILMGLETPDKGEVQAATGARIGYLPQEPTDLDLAKTVLETYRYGHIGYEADFVAKLIGYGLFRLEDMTKRVAQLSVGQRRKLEIARLMAQGPNVLLLDEPTNYISLAVLEAFETAILSFPGPVIAISHDRWFIQRFGGKVWELVDGKLTGGS